MRQSGTVRTFKCFHRHVVSRFFALFLLALILIPFTAPFATIELSQASRGHQHDGLPKDKTDSEEKLVVPLDYFILPLAPSIAGVRSVVPAHSRAEHPQQYTVLRL